MEIHARPGDRVSAGTPLLTLHSDDAWRFARAREALDGAYTIGAEPPTPPPLIIDRIA